MRFDKAIAAGESVQRQSIRLQDATNLTDPGIVIHNVLENGLAHDKIEAVVWKWQFVRPLDYRC